MTRTTLVRAIDAIYLAASDVNAWPTALLEVANYVGGSGAMLVRNDMVNNSGSIINGGLRDDLGELYVREYCRNPLVLAIARYAAIGQPIMAGTIIDFSEVRKTAFNADILCPQGIVDQIAVPHHALSQNGCTGGFAVTLTSRHLDDGMAGTKRMARLAPHLSRALDLSLDLARHRVRAGQYDRLLDMLPGAALLLDGAGRVVRTNNAAEAVLVEADGVDIGPEGVLAAVLPHEARRLDVALSAAILASFGRESDAPFRQAVSIQRRSGLPPLLLVLTPLPGMLTGLLGIGDREARLLVHVIDPVSRLDARTGLLQQAYGLTLAEARVAGLIASGLTAPQAAEALGLLPSTVRTHLARCFDKTGTHSQVALARLVTALALV